MRDARLIGLALCGLAVACATADETATTDRESEVVPAMDAGTDVDSDTADSGSDVADAGPEPCVPGTFCPMSLFGLSDDLLPHKARIEVIRGRSSSDVWAMGALGAIAHFDGSKWTRQHVNPAYSLSGLWLKRDGLLAVSTGRIAFAHDLQLQPVVPPMTSVDGWFQIAEPTGPAPDAYSDLSSMWMLPEAEWLWGTLLRGSPDTGQPTSSSGLWRARVVDGHLDFGDVLSSNECAVYRCQSMHGLHGASPDDLWSVGSSGVILHVSEAQSDAPVYTPFNSRTLVDLFAVWASASDDAWAVGAQGTLLHYHDGAWKRVEQTVTKEHLYNVWGTSKNDLWAVGAKATVLHYDGSEWKPFPVTGLAGATPDLMTVWPADSAHVWIGGDSVLLALGGQP